jgi:large subunit ribosomal protein L4
MIRAILSSRAPACPFTKRPLLNYADASASASMIRRAPRPTYFRCLGTSVSTAESDINESLPSNLTFDLRSSFAPRVEPILSIPSKESIDEEKTELDSEDSDIDYLDDNVDDDEPDYASLDVQRHVVPLPDRLKTNVHYGLDGSVSGTLWLDPSVFGNDPIRIDLIKQSVDYIRNKIRGRRKAKTKKIGEVSGSGRKVRQQKGTGKARAGHSRPAHWRGGAKAHGPRNATDYGNVKMNKKTKRLAMANTLSQKLKEGNLIVVDSLRLESHKTSPWATVLESAFNIGLNGSSALIVDHYHDSSPEGDTVDHASHNGVPINLWVASGNIAKVKVVNQSFANVYDIMKKEKLIVTLSALEILEKRLKG